MKILFVLALSFTHAQAQDYQVELIPLDGQHSSHPNQTTTDALGRAMQTSISANGRYVTGSGYTYRGSSSSPIGTVRSFLYERDTGENHIHEDFGQTIEGSISFWGVYGMGVSNSGTVGLLQYELYEPGDLNTQLFPAVSHHPSLSHTPLNYEIGVSSTNQPEEFAVTTLSGVSAAGLISGTEHYYWPSPHPLFFYQIWTGVLWDTQGRQILNVSRDYFPGFRTNDHTNTKLTSVSPNGRFVAGVFSRLYTTPGGYVGTQVFVVDRWNQSIELLDMVPAPFNTLIDAKVDNGGNVLAPARVKVEHSLVPGSPTADYFYRAGDQRWIELPRPQQHAFCLASFVKRNIAMGYCNPSGNDFMSDWEGFRWKIRRNGTVVVSSANTLVDPSTSIQGVLRLDSVSADGRAYSAVVQTQTGRIQGAVLYRR